jgi:putative membrane-bound dehydrogenase-like protein
MSRFRHPICRVVLAATGALAGADFPGVYNSETSTAARQMPAAEAAAAMKLPPGFRATVFAAEPDVRNPIAMAWDHRGRLWVAENYTFAEGRKRFDLDLRDRVLVFEDADHDGRAEKRGVFTDQVRMLTSLEIGRGGTWLLCPPQLLFVPDADGDDVPDGPPQVRLDGFEVAKGSHHNFANGLRWGPDGWLYGRCGHSCPGRIGVPGSPDARRIPIKGGIWRFHPDTRVFEVISHGTTNPWGHDWDRHGEGFFINTVNGHLWHLIAGAQYKESSGHSPNPAIYERLDMHADHWHFDTGAGWQASRDGKANDLGGGHAHVGMMIYQADQWPETYQNRLFTLNLHGRRANVERLERSGSGYLGRHEPDVFLMQDPWFRGLDISTGPDGSAYLLDWSDTGECHESTGVHRTSGRIYRISHGDPAKPDLAKFAALTPESVDRALRHPNAWVERRQRTRLAVMADPDRKRALAEMLLERLRADPDTVVRLRALWALRALRADSGSLLRELLGDRDEHLRVWAIRLLTDEWPIDTLMGTPPGDRAPVDAGLLANFVAMAATDSSGLVRLALASTLQRLPVAQRAGLAGALAGRAGDAADHNLPALVWYGVSPLGAVDPLALVPVAAACRWPDTVRWIARHLAEQSDRDPAPLDALLRAMMPDRAGSEAVLEGVAEGLAGRRQAVPPAAWAEFIAPLAGLESCATRIRELSVVFGDGRALAEVRRMVADPRLEPAKRQAALRSLIEARPDDLRTLCEGLLDTRGLNGIAARGLAGFDDPAIAKAMAGRYLRFEASDRPGLLELLASRPAWAAVLLGELKAGRIPRADLTPFHARQIRSLGDESLARELEAVWGKMRESPDDKQKLMAQLKRDLAPEVLARADLGKGRALYHVLCSSCHTLYGEGGKLGPDLTGSGRANLDYLLASVIDPSALVGADYRMSLIRLEDGRTLSGIVAARDEGWLSLSTLAGAIPIMADEVVTEETSEFSLMPEGLLAGLDTEQVRDLMAYLMAPTQVPRAE